MGQGEAGRQAQVGSTLAPFHAQGSVGDSAVHKERYYPVSDIFAKDFFSDMWTAPSFTLLCGSAKDNIYKVHF